MAFENLNKQNYPSHEALEQVHGILTRLRDLPLRSDCSLAILPLLDLEQSIQRLPHPGRELQQAISLTFQLVGDMREIKSLADPLIAFHARLEWIETELALAIDPGTKDAGEGFQKCEAWRRYFAEDSNAIPHHAALAYNRSLELGNFSEALSNIHQLAGRFDLFARELCTLISDPSPSSVQNLQLGLGRLELLVLQHTGPLTIPADYREQIDQAYTDLRGMHAVVESTLSLPGDARAAVISHASATLSAISDSLYRQLCELGGIAPLPAELRVLEYSSAITGLPQHLFEEVHEIAESLTIDPSRSEPQEGFGRSIPVAEVQHILQTLGAHLYCLKYRNETVGFHTLLAERDSFPATLMVALDFVQQKGLLPLRSRIGGCEIFGIAKDARVSLARAGVRASTVMHEAMIESARTEQLDALVAVCRLGAQANTASLNAHRRHGWEVVGEITRGSTPYAVLLLQPDSYYQHRTQLAPLVPADSALQQLEERIQPKKRVLRNLATRTPYEPSNATDAVKRALQAPEISEARALRTLTESLASYIQEVVPLQCTEGLCLQARTSNLHFAVRQVLPGRDHWTYDSYGQRIQGTIANMAAAVQKDIQSLD